MTTYANGFSVRIFIPSGKPEGLRIVEKSNWTGQGHALSVATTASLQFAVAAKRVGARKNSVSSSR